MNINEADDIKLYKYRGLYYFINGHGSWEQFIEGSSSALSGLFSQIVNGSAVSETTDEESLVGTGEGSLSIPENGFAVGDSFHAKIGGVISAINTETLHVRIKAGSIILADTGVLSLSATTTKSWEVEMDFTIRAIGAAGVADIVTNGQFIHNKNANNVYEGQAFNSENNTDFDTTVSNTLDVTAEWGSNNGGNSIQASSFILFKTF